MPRDGSQTSLPITHSDIITLQRNNWVARALDLEAEINILRMELEAARKEITTLKLRKPIIIEPEKI